MRAQTARLRLEYRDSIARTKDLVASVRADALRRKPHPGGWCAVECIEHLTLTADDYVRRIREALDETSPRPARAEEKLTMAGKLFMRWFEPPVRRRFTAAPHLVPTATDPRLDFVAGRFEKSHLSMIALLEETDPIDRMRIRVPMADFDWIRLTLFDTFCVVAAHDRRHLWQAERAARA